MIELRAGRVGGSLFLPELNILMVTSNDEEYYWQSTPMLRGRGQNKL
jgi:hypothetical protein